MERVADSRQYRLEKKLRDQMVEVRKKVPIKEKVFTDLEMVDVRSIIYSYLYIVLTSNKDLNSYLFTPEMILKHSICKDYIHENKISEKSMDQALRKAIAYLLAN